MSFNFIVSKDRENSTITCSTDSNYGVKTVVKISEWGEYTVINTITEANYKLLDYFILLIKEFKKGSEGAIERIKKVSKKYNIKFFFNENINKTGEYYDELVFVDKKSRTVFYFERVDDRTNISVNVILKKLINSIRLLEENYYNFTDPFKTPFVELWIRCLKTFEDLLIVQNGWFIIMLLSKIYRLDLIELNPHFLNYIRDKYNLGPNFSPSDLREKLDNIIKNGLEAIENRASLHLKDNLEMEIIDLGFNKDLYGNPILPPVSIYSIFQKEKGYVY